MAIVPGRPVSDFSSPRLEDGSSRTDALRISTDTRFLPSSPKCATCGILPTVAFSPDATCTLKDRRAWGIFDSTAIGALDICVTTSMVFCYVLITLIVWSTNLLLWPRGFISSFAKYPRCLDSLLADLSSRHMFVSISLSGLWSWGWCFCRILVRRGVLTLNGYACMLWVGDTKKNTGGYG